MTAQDDAREFGLHLRAGGWRLGLLVARSVEAGTGEGRPPRNRRDHDGFDKVSARQFAKESSTSADRVLRHLAAWERAAADGLVPEPGILTPDTEIDLNGDDLPPWSEYYDGSSRTSESGTIRSAKALIKRRPAAARELLDDPEVSEAVEREVVERFERKLPSPSPEPFAADVYAEGNRIRQQVINVRRDIERLRPRCEPDQWADIERTLREELDALDATMKMAAL